MRWMVNMANVPWRRLFDFKLGVVSLISKFFLNRLCIVPPPIPPTVRLAPPTRLPDTAAHRYATPRHAVSPTVRLVLPYHQLPTPPSPAVLSPYHPLCLPTGTQCPAKRQAGTANILTPGARVVGRGDRAHPRAERAREERVPGRVQGMVSPGRRRALISPRETSNFLFSFSISSLSY